MKLTNHDFILLEVFKKLYKPNYQLSTAYLMTQTNKQLGIRVGLDATKKFLLQMQEQGYGQLTIATDIDFTKGKNARYYNSCKYIFNCK